MAQKLFRKLSQWFFDFGEIIIIILVIAVATSFIWLPILIAQLSYGDWTCAIKYCVVLKDSDSALQEFESKKYGTIKMADGSYGEYGISMKEKESNGK